MSVEGCKPRATVRIFVALIDGSIRLPFRLKTSYYCTQFLVSLPSFLSRKA
jgi:hypothetical protein